MSSRAPLRRLGLLAAAVLALLPGLAAADPAQLEFLVDRIETAYQTSDLAGLEDTRRQLLRQASTAPAHSRAGYYAAYARFRQALGSTGDKDSARAFLDDCITELTAWVGSHPRDAEARALLGSCYGMSTTHYPLALVARGLEARKHMAMARELAPANPWVLLQDGLADFATPRLFGGNRSAAIAKLERAARLFADAHAGGSQPAGWAVVETWQQLALMYAATGQQAAAAEASDRAANLPRPASARLRQASL